MFFSNRKGLMLFVAAAVCVMMLAGCDKPGSEEIIGSGDTYGFTAVLNSVEPVKFSDDLLSLRVTVEDGGDLFTDDENVSEAILLMPEDFDLSEFSQGDVVAVTCGGVTLSSFPPTVFLTGMERK